MPDEKPEAKFSEKPVSVRFTELMLEDINSVSKQFGLSKQDVIRLSVAAGLRAFQQVGIAGMEEFLASPITENFKNESKKD